MSTEQALCPPRAYRIRRWANDRAYASTSDQVMLVELGERPRIRYTVSERVLDLVSKASFWWLTHVPHRHLGEHVTGGWWICVWCDKDMDP